MKKQSSYALKRVAQNRTQAYQEQQATQQRAEQALRAAIRADVRGLQIDAGIHTYTGASAANMINLTGRLCFITAAGFGEDHPDMRIVRGLAECLGNLAADHDSLERHRASLQSGLAAIDRLLPECDDFALVCAADRLETLLASTAGIGTADVRDAMKLAA
jgi:hypothetical protein